MTLWPSLPPMQRSSAPGSRRPRRMACRAIAGKTCASGSVAAREADVDEMLADVADRPTSFPLVVPPFRRALLARFPYAIYFRELDDSVQVFAVFHARRDPSEL